MNGKTRQLADGELRVCKPWRTEVCLTFIRTDNIDNGYGISRTFSKHEMSRKVVQAFVRQARSFF
jgi:hypothetical protein